MKDLKTYKYKLPDHFNLYDIMESGQVFMYYPHEKGFIIQTLNKRAYLEEDEDTLIIKSDHDPSIFYITWTTTTITKGTFSSWKTWAFPVMSWNIQTALGF